MSKNTNLKKLNPDGSIAQTINVDTAPRNSGFESTNIWVPKFGDNSLTVVRVKDAVGNSLSVAFVLPTLIGNGLSLATTVAFDGEPILVTNLSNNSVSLWKAADLTLLSTFPSGAGTHPFGACSDGLNFRITFEPANQLARF